MKPKKIPSSRPICRGDKSIRSEALFDAYVFTGVTKGDVKKRFSKKHLAETRSNALRYLDFQAEINRKIIEAKTKNERK